MSTYQVATAKTIDFQGFSSVRLTRRGRLFARGAVLLSVLVLIASSYSAVSGAAAGSSSTPKGANAHLEVVIVAPGESLWSIAKLLGGDHEETVSRIMELNALTSPTLNAGDRLIIPTRG